jgi:hypothetical protein
MESDMTREAPDRRPDPMNTVAAQLAGAGLLAPALDVADAPSGTRLRALEAEVGAWLDARPDGLGLSDAVLTERDGR